MFYHNHRPYKSGKRQGKAPIELLTGTPLEAPWWELLRQQINTKRGVTALGTGLSRPPLQLVVHNDRCTDRQAIASGQTTVDPIDTTANDCRHQDSEAALIVPSVLKASLRAWLQGLDCADIQP